ncbi:RNA polymerase sigma factor [Streptomyces sp. NPDC006967]|uniref:RNA polymerase sigma factor n=1 Tax=Streptomyces sp. NPDC006967 TaxID=3156906 RepID=UPI0033CD3A6D
MLTHVTDKITSAGGTGTELVARAVAGDREAFAALYNEYRGEVFTNLYSRTRDRGLAEDLTQDVFLRALRRLETFSGPRASGFAGWLAVIARNIHLDHVKLARTRLEVPVAEMLDNDQLDRSAEASALRDLDVADATETVAYAMRTLNQAQRECVRLRFFEGLSVPETAAKLGKATGATKTLQFRAMEKMRAELAAETAGAVAA